MPKQPISSPLFDVYSWVWKSCLALWQLFPLKLLLLAVQYVPLFFCAAALFGPFVAKDGLKVAQGMSHPESFDWNPVLSDLISMMTDIRWIGSTVLLGLLFLTWWCLVLAASDGGVFGTFWDYFRQGRLFSLSDFYQRGLHLLAPMLWLQFYLSLWALGFFAAWGVLAPASHGCMTVRSRAAASPSRPGCVSWSAPRLASATRLASR